LIHWGCCSTPAADGRKGGRSPAAGRPAPRPGSVVVEVPVAVEVVLLVEHLLVARAYPSSDSIIRIRRSARFLTCRTRSGVTPSLPAISPRASGPSPPMP